MTLTHFHKHRLALTLTVLLTTFTVATLIISCDRKDHVTEKQAKEDTSEKPIPNNEQTITLAVHPYASPIELVKNYSPLLEYLRRNTGKPFALSVCKSYETHIASIGADEADIALMGPATYVTMAERFAKKRLLCVFEMNGSPEFQGYIIARKNSPATSLKDLQGKSFASSSRESTISYIVPRYMFIEAGVPFPEKHLRIVGSHNNVCLNILAGDIYAGAVRETVFQKYKNRGLKVIAVSPKVTEHLFIATDRLDAETYTQIKKMLTGIKDKDEIKKLLTPIKSTLTGLAPVEDKDYDVLRAMMAAVREDEKRFAEERKRPK